MTDDQRLMTQDLELAMPPPDGEPSRAFIEALCQNDEDSSLSSDSE
jgi:hypothetical protein